MRRRWCIWSFSNGYQSERYILVCLRFKSWLNKNKHIQRFLEEIAGGTSHLLFQYTAPTEKEPPKPRSSRPVAPCCCLRLAELSNPLRINIFESFPLSVEWVNALAPGTLCQTTKKDG